MAFPAKQRFHVPPHHTRLPGKILGQASQALALLMLTRCSQEAAQLMKGGGAAVFAGEPEKKRIECAREDVWETD